MKKNFIKTVILFQILVSFSSLAQGALVSSQLPYYGQELFDELKAGVKDKSLLMRLKVILKGYHTVKDGQPDELHPNCVGNCYAHSPVGYRNARYFLLANYYLFKTDRGYGVHDVYCDHDVMPEDFKGRAGAGPDRLPDDSVINVEHTWPQSRFTTRYSNEMQKSDLHHLFPTNSKTNSIRGNNKFGEVERDLQQMACSNVRTGVAAGGHEEIFEPPQEHKGNVARALFYFATRYDMQIDPDEEAFLRQWHKADPVDDEERNRNEQIFSVQRTRNPFIDYPELVDSIDNF